MRRIPIRRPVRRLPRRLAVALAVLAGWLPLAAAPAAPDPLVWDATEKEHTAAPGELSATLHFSVTNVGPTEVVIQNISTSCGCSLAKLPSKPWHLPPGAAGRFSVVVDLRGKRGVISKVAAVEASSGPRLLAFKVRIPEAPAMEAAERARNTDLARADRQAVFQGDCARCHREPTVGKLGEELYQAACAICHDSEHRATMVPDLHGPGPAVSREYWSTWIAKGREATLMPAFARAHGGPLSREQVESLVDFLTRPQPATPAGLFHFGTVDLEKPLEHTFEFQNRGTDTLQLASVEISAPLAVAALTGKVPPGERGTVRIRLGTPRPTGEFLGDIVLGFKNPGVRDIVFQMAGRMVPPIEFDPFPAFFVATQRGQSKRASIRIANHADEPLEILRVEHGSARFQTDLETVEAGRRYTLSLTLKGEGPVGKQTDTITLVTSRKPDPLIRVQASTLIRERVYTFPDLLDFGRIRLDSLKQHPERLELLGQTLMVYQVGGTNFQVSVHTDVPGLQLTAEPSRLKDRFQVRVAISPAQLREGGRSGSLVLRTNDKDFPEVVVPVRLTVEGKW